MEYLTHAIVYSAILIISLKWIQIFKKSKKDIRVILNLDSDFPPELIRKVEEAVNAKPIRLTLQIQQRAHLDQDVVLNLIWLLENRDQKTHLHVDLRSSIFNGVLQLVLMAQTRTIRPHCWALIDSPKRLQKESTSSGVDEDDDEDFGSIFRHRSSSGNASFVHDYLKIAEMMGEYVVVEEIADRRWDLANLKEYLLLPTEEEERSFRRLFMQGDKETTVMTLTGRDV